jgi:hypothetical protein
MLCGARSGSPFMFIDTDHNGEFGVSERFSFIPTRHRFEPPHPGSPPAGNGSLFGHSARTAARRRAPPGPPFAR